MQANPPKQGSGAPGNAPMVLTSTGGTTSTAKPKPKMIIIPDLPTSTIKHGRICDMAKIIDKETSKPRMVNSTHCWVWEVSRYVWDDYAEDYVLQIKGIFFDPWKATEWAIQKYNVGASIQACIYHINSCL